MQLQKPIYDQVPQADIEAVLEHVARYRLTVFAALERLPAFTDGRPSNIKRTLRECKRRSLLASAPLHVAARYWHLTLDGAAQFRLATNHAGPLSEAAKIRAYAVLRFCWLSDRPRYRLTDDDIANNFPELHRSGLPTGYYFEPGDDARLGLARVDAGNRGRWDRNVESVREDIDDHWRHGGFRKLIDAGRFEITVLTVFKQKAKRISDTLSQHLDARRVPVRVVAIPELLPLIASVRERR
jgi:hypothetical protein